MAWKLGKSVRMVPVGNVYVTLTSDVNPDFNTLLDTRVEIDDSTLCWIAGNEINDFINEFTTLVDKYRI